MIRQALYTRHVYCTLTTRHVSCVNKAFQSSLIQDWSPINVFLLLFYSFSFFFLFLPPSPPHLLHLITSIFFTLQPQCNTVLSALGKAKQCDTAVRLYTDMTLNGPYPDRVTNLTMISVYERADRFDAGAVVRNYLGMSPALVRRVESPTVSGAGAVATGEGNVTVSGPAGAKGRESKGRKEVSTGTSSKSRTPLKPLRKTAKLDKTGSSQVSVKITERTSKDEEYFPAGIRLSPAGTLKDKLMESGRRRVGQATSDKMTRIGADGGIEEFVEPSRAGDAVSGTATAGSVMTLPSAAGTADDSSGEIEEMEGGRRRRSAGGELRWEKGGGGAASVMTLLGLAGRSAEAEELLLSLETEGVEALPASLYNAASKLSHRPSCVSFASPCFPRPSLNILFYALSAVIGSYLINPISSFLHFLFCFLLQSQLALLIERGKER